MSSGTLMPVFFFMFRAACFNAALNAFGLAYLVTLPALWCVLFGTDSTAPDRRRQPVSRSGQMKRPHQMLIRHHDWATPDPAAAAELSGRVAGARGWAGPRLRASAERSAGSTSATSRQVRPAA